MGAYSVKVSTAATFDHAMDRFPEMRAAMAQGVRVLAAPEAPAIDVAKLRSADAAPVVASTPRRAGL